MKSTPARLAFLVLLALAACGKTHEPEAALPVVTVSAPLEKDVVDWDDFVGRFEAMDQVAAPLAGRVSDRRVAVGNLVNADSTVLTTLVSLDPIRFAFDGSEALYLKYQRDNSAGARKSSRGTSNPVLIRLQDESEYRWKG